MAILCSDLHLSLKPPLARSGEKDWLQAMRRSFTEMSLLSQRHRRAPIICAGDIFDRWDSPPELINWAIDNLPHMWVIPGQHDLPHHEFQRSDRSAYGTLLRARRPPASGEYGIEELSDRRWTTVSFEGEGSFPEVSLQVIGYPWGFTCLGKPPQSGDNARRVIRLGVFHSYCWIPEHGHPGALPELEAKHHPIKHFDVAHFGDNHNGFSCKIGKTTVFNSGTFFRRKTDEFTYKPRVGLLRSDGSVVTHYLDTSDDVILKPAQERELSSHLLPFSELVREMRSTHGDLSDEDFESVLMRYLAQPGKVSGPVALLLQSILRGCR